MIPVSPFVLPYYLAGRITLEEADEVEAKLLNRLGGLTIDSTSVSFLVREIEDCIEKVKE